MSDRKSCVYRGLATGERGATLWQSPPCSSSVSMTHITGAAAAAASIQLGRSYSYNPSRPHTIFIAASHSTSARHQQRPYIIHARGRVGLALRRRHTHTAHACLLACSLACVLARLLACSLACVLACLLACVLACLLPWRHDMVHAVSGQSGQSVAAPTKPRQRRQPYSKAGCQDADTGKDGDT
jgi:hypothetical protein